MSLTTILQNKDIRKLFTEEFKKPKIQLEGEIKAEPTTSNYAEVGTAFDYLLRFIIQQQFQEKTTAYPWIALITRKEFLSSPMVDQFLEYSEKYHKKFLDDGILRKEIMLSTLKLAKLDSIVRVPTLEFTHTPKHPNKEDIIDLEKLASIINMKDFKVKNKCLLNPNFHFASSLVDGADCDLVIDNELIDIKTTKKFQITRDMFNQILGYYTLAYINDGFGVDRGIKWEEVDKIGFYFSRYGQKVMYDIKDIINFKTYPMFVEKFIELILQKQSHNPQEYKTLKEFVFNYNKPIDHRYLFMILMKNLNIGYYYIPK